MLTTQRLRLFVSPSGGDWVVQWERGPGWRTGSEITSVKVESTHATQPEAIAAARGVVGRLIENTCSQIVVQGTDGRVRADWTYGTEPFPPRT